MIGGVIVGFLVVATCAWMAFGDDDPRWVRGAVRNLAYIVGGGGALILVFWALQEYNIIR